jgi:DNA polymerase III gamma/tau subunit
MTTSPPSESATSALLPPPDGDAPLFELGRDELSVFLYLAFTDEELTQLMRELKLTVPGYRLEKLSGVQKADTLADEIRARPDARGPAIALLRKIYEFPALDAVSLSAQVAEEIGLLAVEDDATVRMLWRLLADPQAEVRKTATPVLQALARTYYGTGAAPEGMGPVSASARPAPPPKAPAPRDESQELKAAKKEAREAMQAAEKAQAKADALAQQLKDARTELAEALRELNQLKKAAMKTDSELEKTKEQLEKAKGKVTRAELDRVRKELEKANEAVAALTAREERLVAEKRALEAELEALKKAPEPAPQVVAANSEEPAVEELPSTWLKPIFTQEFYDSLEGWDARLQRAAFKQAFLLSENHRHPSLRAIPLEGLPGYYRVRVATDVRLIYRRSEGTSVDILSLIDREDLDRYVRQAKTR